MSKHVVAVFPAAVTVGKPSQYDPDFIPLTIYKVTFT